MVNILLDIRQDAKTRGFAAEGLGLLPPTRRSTNALIKMLHDQSTEVRYSALCALGALRSKAALRSIESLLNERVVMPGEMSLYDRASEVIASIRGEL